MLNIQKKLPFFAALAVFAVVIAASVDACKPGGEEGDQCNFLILQQSQNCKDGLVCKLKNCANQAYCCPANGSSTDPNCNGEGCPDPNEEAGADAADEAAVSNDGALGGDAEGGSSFDADASSSSDASDASDSG